MYRLSGEVGFAFRSRTRSRNFTTFGPASSTRHGSRYISETRNGRAIATEFNMTCTLVTNFRVQVSRANRLWALNWRTPVARQAHTPGSNRHNGQQAGALRLS